MFLADGIMSHYFDWLDRTPRLVFSEAKLLAEDVKSIPVQWVVFNV